MKKADLHFDFPESLIAKEPLRPSRICSGLNEGPSELSWPAFLDLFQSGDALILNNTKVLKRRIFNQEGLEILFLDSVDRQNWQVLFPSRRFKVGAEVSLPGNITITLVEKGRPQNVRSSQPLGEDYFDQYGELPLPPYIQKVREDRHSQPLDDSWYQTLWNEKPGSYAAPTASLHFNSEHLQILRDRGVKVGFITLHVGLGTFLPVEVDDLAHHPMHSEEVDVPFETLQIIEGARQQGAKVWAMGTTVTRALESVPVQKLQRTPDGYRGNTDLLILPGFQFKMIDCLLTNFHQPESTLLALVMAFAGVEKVKGVYRWAIEHKFRLFSYGDLSVWIRA